MAGPPFTVTVRDNVREVLASLNGLERELGQKAALRAINRAGQQTATFAARTLGKRLGLPVGDVRAMLHKYRSGLTFEITVRGKAPNLIHFGARQTKRGVSARAWGIRKVYRGTFIANKGRTVFKRVGKERTPIKPIWGPSIANEFHREPFATELRKKAEESFVKNFEADLRYYLAKWA